SIPKHTSSSRSRNLVDSWGTELDVSNSALLIPISCKNSTMREFAARVAAAIAAPRMAVFPRSIPIACTPSLTQGGTERTAPPLSTKTHAELHIAALESSSETRSCPERFNVSHDLSCNWLRLQPA